MKVMKISILLMALLTFYGCTYTASPYPMKPDMISSFHAKSTIKIINTQTVDKAEVERSGLNVNLREATESAIRLLEDELKSRGVKIDNNASRSLSLSIDKLLFGNYFMVVGCTATMSITTGNGLMKTIKEHNISGVGLPQACDFAITKAIASVVNDSEIRSYITTGSSNSGNIKDKLIDLQNLLDSGLITADEYNEKRAKLIESL